MKIETDMVRVTEEQVEQVSSDEILIDSLGQGFDAPASKPTPRLYRVIWQWHFKAIL